MTPGRSTRPDWTCSNSFPAHRWKPRRTRQLGGGRTGGSEEAAVVPEEAAFANGRSGAPADTHVGSEIVALRAQCRRQLHVINALGEAVGTLKRGAKALTDENAELRADNDRLHGSHVLTSRAAD